MLQLIRNNSPYTVLILFIVFLLVRFQALLHPVAPVALPDSVVFQWVLSIFDTVLGRSPFGYTLLALVMIFGQGLYLNAIAMRHRLFGKASYIPAFYYLVLASILPDYVHFTEALLMNWSLLAALNAILQFSQPLQPRRHIFNAGFFLALASLFQSSLLLFILLLIIAMILLRPFHPAEWVVALLGFLTPFYFFTCILFLMDKLPALRAWPAIGISLPKEISTPVHLLGSLGGVLILVFFGLYVLQSQMPKSTIYVRRAWGAIVAYVIVAVLAAVFTRFPVKAAWLIVLPPIALIASQSLYREKPPRFSTFIFYFSLLFVVFCQAALGH